FRTGIAASWHGREGQAIRRGGQHLSKTLTAVRSANSTMQPIDLRLGGSTCGMSATQFRKKVVDICNEHRKEKRALVFAFLLFDRRHGQVARVLDDIRFYETLDEIAGSLL